MKRSGDARRCVKSKKVNIAVLLLTWLWLYLYDSLFLAAETIPGTGVSRNRHLSFSQFCNMIVHVFWQLCSSACFVDSDFPGFFLPLQYLTDSLPVTKYVKLLKTLEPRVADNCCLVNYGMLL